MLFRKKSPAPIRGRALVVESASGVEIHGNATEIHLVATVLPEGLKDHPTRCRPWRKAGACIEFEVRLITVTQPKLDEISSVLCASAIKAKVYSDIGICFRSKPDTGHNNLQW
jgi:hypothetical protein